MAKKRKTREELEQEYFEAHVEFVNRQPFDELPDTFKQGKQREIVLYSLGRIRSRRRDVHYFNKLGLRYHFHDQARLVVPDNLVVLHPEELVVSDCYRVDQQPARPFWAFDYVSHYRRPAEYAAKLTNYAELSIPYVLVFQTEDVKLALYRFTPSGYVPAAPGADGRFAVEEIETQVGLLGDWVRFWFRGELVVSFAEQRRQVEDLDQQIKLQDAEINRLRALLHERGG